MSYTLCHRQICSTLRQAPQTCARQLHSFRLPEQCVQRLPKAIGTSYGFNKQALLSISTFPSGYSTGHPPLSLLRKTNASFRFQRCQSSLASTAGSIPAASREASVASEHSSPSSSSSRSSQSAARLTAPAVSTHLFIISGLVFAIVVVGGLTRLTESGLSITEWNLVTGTMPPLSREAWLSEYNKYMVTPEGTLMNKTMTLDEFKRIYAWEWGHRFLGRVIGIAFLAPIPFFIIRRQLSPRSAVTMGAIAALIGGQGALGWYMVKSGLTHEAIQARDGVPRVSQYRLAAHLGMAFLVFSLSLRHAISIRRDWAVKQLLDSVGTKRIAMPDALRLLQTPQAARLRGVVTALTGMIFLTAISGAFVAGLDAGLLYNTFPHMGDDWIPPISELYSHKYARSPDQSDLVVRNMLENPTTVQFDHRVLAVSTFSAIVGLLLYARRPSMRPHVPAASLKFIKGMTYMAVLQVSLGISTLVYMVPIELAAAHQAGSLVLLTLAIAAGSSLRRPGQAAQKLLRGRFQTSKHPAPVYHAPVRLSSEAA